MPTIISANQSAFVQGRHISENVLLAHELVNGYNMNKLSLKYAIKIDLKKAFDSTDWNSLLDVLAALHFPFKFIK